MQTPKEKNMDNEIKTKRHTSSIVSDIEVKKSCYFNKELEFFINNF